MNRQVLLAKYLLKTFGEGNTTKMIDVVVQLAKDLREMNALVDNE